MRIVKSMAVQATILSLLAGCARFEAKPLSPQRTAEQFEARTLDAPQLKAFLEANLNRDLPGWPLHEWDFDTLTLAALFYHPSLDVARAQWAVAQAGIETAGGRPNPTADFAPTYDANPGGVPPWTLGLALDWPIETAGKRGYRMAQAQSAANSARLNLASTSWQVRSRVREGLLALYAANLTQELLTKQQAVQNQTVELLEDRLQAGQSSLTEVQLVRVAAAQTALQLHDAQKQSAQAHVQLADALGIPVVALADTILSFAVFDQLADVGNSDALRREALLHRADVLGALADYEARQSALQLEIAKQYPDIHLGLGYAWDQGENKYSLGVSLTLPVLNRNQGPIAEAEAQRQQAGATFIALQARVLGDVDAALAGYRDGLRKLQTADSLLSDQRKRMQLAQESFETGASDRLALLQTQLELRSGEIARANALVESQQALGVLEDALQRPLSPAP